MSTPMPRQYEVRISDEAYSDLEAIFTHIREDSPQNAGRMIEHLLTAIESLDAFPGRYKVYRPGGRRGGEVHSMPVPPYVVYYRVIQGVQLVHILTVRHGARRRPGRLG